MNATDITTGSGTTRATKAGAEKLLAVLGKLPAFRELEEVTITLRVLDEDEKHDSWAGADGYLRGFANNGYESTKVWANVGWADKVDVTFRFDVRRGDDSAPHNLLVRALRSQAEQYTGRAAPAGKTVEEWAAHLREFFGDMHDSLVRRWTTVLERLPADDEHVYRAPDAEPEDADPWGDSPTPAIDAGSAPAPLPTTPMVPASSLVVGTVSVNKPRVNGKYGVHVGADRYIYVDVETEAFGRSYTGSVYFDGDPLKERYSSTYIRGTNFSAPTEAAYRAMREGAKAAVDEWLARHPLAFEAADCIAAGEKVKGLRNKVDDLRKQLAEVEQEERDATQAHWDRREALMAKGVTTEDIGR